MLRPTLFIALLLAGCTSAGTGSVAQTTPPTPTSASHPALQASSKPPACYKTQKSVDQGDFDTTVSDSEC